MKIINAHMHSAMDYAIVAFLFLSPTYFGLPETASLVTYALGAIHLLLTVLTKYRLGLFKLIPFRVHGLIELAVSIGLFGLAYWLGGIEGKLPQYFYSSFAIMILTVWLLTDYKDTNSRGY